MASADSERALYRAYIEQWRRAGPELERVRAEGSTVIGPFHSRMEKECLRILLRSRNPVLWCLARGRFRRVPARPDGCARAVSEGRLVILSAFPDDVPRVTEQTAAVRNRMVCDGASAVVVAHAAPGSKMERLSRALLDAGKPVYTFDHPAHAALLQAGARPVGSGTVSDWITL